MWGALSLLLACGSELPDPTADPCTERPPPGVYDLSFEWDGWDRSARVYVPDGIDGPRNLVLVLHGWMMGSETMNAYTGYEDFADAEGFVVVHAEGTGVLRSWNAGGCCGSAVRNAVDDVGYLAALIDTLRDRLCIDRVLVTGMSNGGMLAHRLACERPDVVDGIVPVAGTIAELDGCADGDGMVPILAFHGRRDPSVHYGGTKKMHLWSVYSTMKTWRTRNRCSNAAPTENTFGDVTCTTWDCETPTALCQVRRGGHQWPNARVELERFGHVTRDVDATVDGYAWFASLP